MEELLEESTAGQPHPAAGVHAEVCVQQQLIEHLDAGRRGHEPPGAYDHASPPVTTCTPEKGAKAFCY